MMVALLLSNGQLRTERDGDTEEGCQKPAVQQRTIQTSIAMAECQCVVFSAAMNHLSRRTAPVPMTRFVLVSLLVCMYFTTFLTRDSMVVKGLFH